MLAGAIAGANTELQAVFTLFSNVAEQSLFLTDLLVFLKQPARMQSGPQARPAPRPIRQGLEFPATSQFHYPGSDRLVLDNLTFRIGMGERVALVGENGQGKTTLVKLVARLYDPTGGAILLDASVDLDEHRVDELRREIGVIFQDFFRYDMAVRENIGVGRVDLVGDDAALWDAAWRSKADETIASLPGRLDQMLGRKFEGGVDLSGGQWQRLALARAYLRNAQRCRSSTSLHRPVRWTPPAGSRGFSWILSTLTSGKVICAAHLPSFFDGAHRGPDPGADRRQDRRGRHARRTAGDRRDLLSSVRDAGVELPVGGATDRRVSASAPLREAQLTDLPIEFRESDGSHRRNVAHYRALRHTVTNTRRFSSISAGS